MAKIKYPNLVRTQILKAEFVKTYKQQQQQKTLKITV